MSTPSHTPPFILTEAATFIGIDYHKKYSVYHAVDAAGSDLGKLRMLEEIVAAAKMISTTQPPKPVNPVRARKQA